MRWSQFFIPTVKETPADATVASHRLMIRAGLVRQLAAGAYTYLPLGYRVLRKVEAIVREEMDAAGAVELLMPAMQPIDLWQETGRDVVMGPALIHLKDQPWRKGSVLGPTHEECVTDIARNYINSYKQLPITLYQIQTKFRDEERPKSGVLRTREFLMKDAYSFDADKVGLDASYVRMYDAYCRIFGRCGLPYVSVEADSGPIGGDASHEFMVPTDAGEDVIVRSSGYAANIERATCAPLPQDDTAMVPMAEVHTPDSRTIDEVCAFLGTRPDQMVKTLVYQAVFAGDGGPAVKRTLVALVRGDHEINESKLRRAAGAQAVELADPETIEKLTAAAVGFAGPQGLLDRDPAVQLIVDQGVSVMRNAATGANRTAYHVTGVNPGRDFPLEGERVSVADVRNVAEGDRCPKTGEPLAFVKSIEIGHVFKLGTKYSRAMKADFLDQGGKANPLIMGCYGIGLNRIVAAAIEASHDDAGIIWPMAIAPFHVLIVALDAGDPEVAEVAGRLHDALAERGLDVLLDDRDARPGPKFKDADLIGVPLRVTIGKRGLKEGVVEVKDRDGTDVAKMAPDDAVAELIRRYTSRLAATA
ncbi:MAG: proline--tRNA ligase [Phycisphaerae bacterium]|nr:proline--tRNA ligase [Phycisphaerae bacterium]